MRRYGLAWGTCFGAAAAVASLGLASACGSRTGLPFEEATAVTTDSGDGATKRDVTPDRRPDVLPLIDATPLPDVVRNDCPDAAATLIYVVTTQYDLYSFEPTAGSFKRIGNITCPAPSGATPFSMAVDRRGVAYVVFQNSAGPNGPSLPGNGMLFRVSTSTAACIGTSYVPGQQGIATFGMGFASNTNGPDETLFIASDDGQPRLGAIDVQNFTLGIIGPFNPPITRAELTGTGDGRLFAFYAKSATSSAIAQIDKQTGQVTAESPLATVSQGTHWAFGFWGGDFYTFTGPQGGTTVTRFRPSDNSVADIAQLNQEIVGAGVSTCAPEK